MRALLALLLGLAGCVAVAQAQPPASFTPESSYIPIPHIIQLATYNVAEPTLGSLVVFADSYGCVGDGVADDTTCLTNALAATPANWTLKLTPNKVYRKTALVTAATANVTIWGYGATLYADTNGASNPDLALQLTGNGTNVYGLTITSNLSHRISNTSSAGLWVLGDNHRIIDNRIEYTGTCLFGQGTHIFVGRNVCYKDWADGFTFAGGVGCGCSIDHIIIVGNVVRFNGDDMISIVNYADVDDEEPFITEVLVEHNDVANSYGGAGVAVHGGRDITIRYNTIGPDPCVVGIQLDSQVAFSIRNVRNVLVDSNKITDTQTTTAPYNPSGTCPTPGGVNHGVLYVNAAGGNGLSHHIDSILFVNNEITRGLRKGAQIQEQGTPAGVVTNVGFQGNRFIGIQDTPINVPAGTAVCSENQLVDVSAIAAANCPRATMPTVTGTNYLVM